jgi:glycerol uptake facilitator-like aquaporin
VAHLADEQRYVYWAGPISGARVAAAIIRRAVK